METSHDLVVPLSKSKLTLTLLGSVVFVVLGGWLFTIASEIPRYDPLFVKAAGIAAVGFFGLAAFFATRKLFDKSPGLIINAKGIFDNASGVAAGLIPWNEIRGFSVTTVQFQRFLTIHVRDPEAYLKKGNFLRRVVTKANYKFYDSPVQLSAHSLQINFDELLTTIQQYHKKYGSD